MSGKVPLNPAIELFPVNPSCLSFKTFDESDTDKWSCSCLTPCIGMKEEVDGGGCNLGSVIGIRECGICWGEEL
jgi:hypothetical protein